MANPFVENKRIVEGYKGKIKYQFQFHSSSTSSNCYYLTVNFGNYFDIVSGNTGSPLVCRINGNRAQSCSYTRNPL